MQPRIYADILDVITSRLNFIVHRDGKYKTLATASTCVLILEAQINLH